MKIVNAAFSESLRDFPKFFGAKALWLLGFLLFFEALQIPILNLGAELHNEDLLLALRMTGLLVSVLQTLFGICVLPYIYFTFLRNLKTLPLLNIRRNFVQVSVEWSRAMLKTTLGFVLLIVPGVILAVRYTFVPLIAQFNKKYIGNELDALEHSATLVKGRWWAMGIFLFFTGTLLLSLSVLKLKFSLFSAPEVYLLLLSVSVFCEIFFAMWTLKIYLKLEEECSHELTV